MVVEYWRHSLGVLGLKKKRKVKPGFGNPTHLFICKRIVGRVGPGWGLGVGLNYFGCFLIKNPKH